MNTYENLKLAYSNFYLSDGHCKYYQECKPVGLECKFFSDKVKIGEKYGTDPAFPRLLFIGIEGLHKGESGLVADIEPPCETAYNPHFKGVRYVTAYICQKLLGLEPPKDALKNTLKDFNSTIQYISLANFYKCAFGKGATGLSHTDAMCKYCPSILLDEIKVLEPDLIIIQTVRRPYNFISQFEGSYGKGELLCGNDKTGLFRYSGCQHKPILVLYTYHGSSDPTPGKRSWCNDKRCIYIRDTLNPVLDATVEAMKESGIP